MSGLINSAGSKSGLIGITELDYEEGTWTPVLSDDDSNFSHTLQAGFYTKIGNRVFCNGAVTTNADTGITGAQACRMQGLPFTGSSTSNAFAGGNFVYMAGAAFGQGEDIGIRVETGSSIAYIFIWNSTAGTSNMPCSSWSPDGSGRFAFQYMTDL